MRMLSEFKTVKETVSDRQAAAFPLREVANPDVYLHAA